MLPRERPQGTRVTGIDFTGPLQYKHKTSSKKCYILLFNCSLSRAVHLELLPNQSTDDFVKALKRFVARRARPELVFSDNAKTVIAAEEWIKWVSNDDSLHEYLEQQNIKRRFNLSRAPW